MVDRCVICNEEIPEGRQICKKCEDVFADPPPIAKWQHIELENHAIRCPFCKKRYDDRQLGAAAYCPTCGVRLE